MRRLSNSEHGASAVVIGICLVFLIGFAGLAVDVGALYAERTELQKGAEAAVLAIAEDCGHGTKSCDFLTASATAEDYIDANSTDLAGALDSLELDSVGQTVTVIDQTERADGGSIFLPFFAQVIGFEGTTVRARASAAWGAPSGMATLPIVISECEWDKYGGDPNDWPDYPEEFNPWPTDPSEPLLFTFHDGNTTESCNDEAGQDLPGGFGWLDTGGDDCEAETTDGQWSGDDVGASPSNGCTAAYMASLVGTVVALPWFEKTNDLTGANGEYFIAGYSPFYLTGYNFGGQYKEDSLWDGQLPCKGDERCLEGYFVSGYTFSDGELGGEYRGILIVKLTG